MTTNRDAALAMREAAAKVAEHYARRNYPKASENTDIYRAQADWAASIDRAIRALPLPEVEPAQSVDMVTCGCGDMFPAGSYGHGFMDGAGHCANCVASAPQQVEPSCEWRLSDDESDLWAASCGRESLVYCDGPIEAEINFCPGCGKPLVVKEKNDE